MDIHLRGDTKHPSECLDLGARMEGSMEGAWDEVDGNRRGTHIAYC